MKRVKRWAFSLSFSSSNQVVVYAILPPRIAISYLDPTKRSHHSFDGVGYQTQGNYHQDHE